MAIKDILVFLDDGDSNTDRIATAMALGLNHQAHITGASLGTMKPIYAKLSDENMIARAADKQAHQLVDDFTDQAVDNPIPVKAIVISGDAATSAMRMAHYARNADLVILSQPDPSKDNYSRLQAFAQEVLLYSGRPVLFIPYIGSREVPFKKVLIAWDGTPAASRAVHDAVPLLAQAEQVIVMVVESKKQKEFKKEVMVEGLINHLAHHDVNALLKRVKPGKNLVSSIILNQISSDNFDLLVLGGYGTPTLKQKVFGGVSSILLSSMVVPVLMSH